MAFPRVAHIYATSAKKNSGDFLIGVATKWHFRERLLGLGPEAQVEFVEMDCRNESLFKEDRLPLLNSFDYILVGGGGLLLPDSEPNMNSCWQWNIRKEVLEKLTARLYVVSIGYNLFYGQEMDMPKRQNNDREPARIPILRENLRALVDKAYYFSMRHAADVDSLIELIGTDYREKVSLQFCPTIEYSAVHWKEKLALSAPEKYVGIEIKDDREWRRYYKIGRARFYSELLEFVRYCLENNVPLCIVSHDGSNGFRKFLESQKIKLPVLDNSSANERLIYHNYGKLRLLFCTAGHSQMIAYGLGIQAVPLITHPKLKNFCEDMGLDRYIDVNEELEAVSEKMLGHFSDLW
jgi:hypothetical protein